MRTGFKLVFINASPRSNDSKGVNIHRIKGAVWGFIARKL
jgi:hypothetical protein